MYITAIVVILLYFWLFLAARKEEVPEVSSELPKPFYRMALYLYKRICARRIPIVGQKQVVKDLQRLHPGENKELVCTRYYVGKIAMALLICLVGTLLALVIHVKTNSETLLQEDGTIIRGTYEEGIRELDVRASFEDGTQKEFSVQVGARRLTGQELETLFTKFSEELPGLILGSNPSLQEVSADLQLDESYEGYPFLVEWHSDCLSIVANTGTVSEIEEETVELILSAEIFYEEEEEPGWELQIPVCVVPPIFTEEERLQRQMEELLIREEQGSRLEAAWKLPESFQGQAIYWSQKISDYSIPLWVGALVTAVMVFFFSDKDIHANLEAKRVEMKRFYPDVVQKLVLYMGAGLTVRGAFQRIAGNYEQDKKAGKAEIAIYEEMLYACRELQTGVSEGVVYEHFGKRTGLQEYIRLSTLLMQNLKKGNSTLLQRLREEADKACIEQLQNGRRLGEEASTKLLLPMVLMLVVVMLLIMIPAFSSVGI